MMKVASFGQRARIISATCRSAVRAAAWSGCWNAWRKRGGEHGVLALRHVGERIAGPVHPAALPGGAEDADDRRLQPLMGVGDHQLDAGKAASLEALQEVRPEHLGLRRADVQTDDLAPAVGVDGDGNYRRDRDDKTGFSAFRPAVASYLLFIWGKARF